MFVGILWFVWEKRWKKHVLVSSSNIYVTPLMGFGKTWSWFWRFKTKITDILAAPWSAAKRWCLWDVMDKFSGLYRMIQKTPSHCFFPETPCCLFSLIFTNNLSFHTTSEVRVGSWNVKMVWVSCQGMLVTRWVAGSYTRSTECIYP